MSITPKNGEPTGRIRYRDLPVSRLFGTKHYVVLQVEIWDNEAQGGALWRDATMQDVTTTKERT